jgi:hypothetical protein
VLADAHVAPDVAYARPLDGDLAWIHRQAGETAIYYVASPLDRPLDVDVRFRVTGKVPELWHPDTGARESLTWRADSGRTTVRLHLAEHDAVFVVFREGATATTAVPRVAPVRTTLATVSGPWTLRFPPGLGAPASIPMATLAPWSASTDSGVKYFSGSATYTRTITAPAGWFRRGRALLLSLGEVRDLAEVVVNGTTLPLLWKAPFEADVTRALHSGANRVEIRVTNEWTNRILGDRTAPAAQRVLAPGPPAFGRAPSLPASGLLGPVTILSVDSP